ncbi:putative bifunctional diguanylate cyclase/phosphodiesterase [Comamonas terrae]|uniref:Bifunctional diguanylate cyclase/phosphodiesterase n=1 Tax=Comamonas terrae TaxID=673548 RepID=A0ABW5UFW3_9BURK|nr:EAL domain-containing protein [Comamonas terrae]
MPRTFVHLHAWRLRGLIRTTACAAACMLIAAAPASQAGPGAQAARPQVLVLMSYHPGHSWEDRILAGLNEWGGNGPAKPVFHTEWMDTKRYPGMEQRQRLARYLRDKYAHQRFDLIATVDDNALEFVARQDALFGGTPVVFSGINGDPAQIVGDRPKVTGILERFDLTRTLRTALSLHPGTRHLVFITPQDETGAELRNGVDTALALLPPGPQVEHWIAPDLSRIGERLQQQPRDTLVFVLGSIPAQADQPPLEPEEVTAFVHERTALPVYSDLDTSVGRGAVGGYLNSGLETGRLQAAMARRILEGQAPSQIPYVRETPLALLFDYQQLHRLGVNTRHLPEGSTLLNEPASIFDSEYRQPLIGFSLVVLLLLASVAILVIRSRVLAERQQALHYQATHDDLTGLPNRQGLPELLQQAARNAAGEQEHVALVMLGLNRFKLINDTYGHAFGDAIVAAMAERLRRWRAQREALVRFGGDSFVIVSPFRGEQALEHLRARCEALFSTPFVINGQRIPVTAAFGMSSAPPNALDPERLLREADTAMYEAKRNRRTQVVTFDRRIHVRTTRQFQIEASLPDAIARGEIEVYFQPILDTTRGCIAGFEALARWQHPELGAIPPPEFIRAATESGHIGALTQCVLRKACLDFLPHLASPAQPYLAVNVSVSDIYGGEFPAQLAKTLASLGMPANRLVLEVTEDMLLGDEQLAAETLAQLRAQGVRIAIDDFGTGYSSMGYLSHYQVHIIKIDRSFVRNIATSPQDQKIVRAIISMAADLDLSVITEGVETQEQSALLRSMGCVLQQGYVFSRPQPAAQWAGMTRLPAAAG